MGQRELAQVFHPAAVLSLRIPGPLPPPSFGKTFLLPGVNEYGCFGEEI